MSKKCLHNPCKSWAMTDSDYCYWHDPARQQNHQKQDTTIDTIADVKRVVGKTLAELCRRKTNRDQVARARAIAFLAIS